MPFKFAEFGLVMVLLVFWSLFWKGWALWKAAKNDSKGWFVALLLLNTAGILEILYIYVFGKSAKGKAVEGSMASLDTKDKIV